MQPLLLSRRTWPLLTLPLVCQGCWKESPPAPIHVVRAQPVLAPQKAPEVRLEPAFPNLSFERPVFLAAPPKDGDQVYVVEQCGRIWAFPRQAQVRPEERLKVLDLTSVVLAPGNKEHPGGNEEGLLGFAFHPNFAQNHTVFAHYSVAVGAKGRKGRLSRFHMAADGTVDVASEAVLLEVDQPEANHNGGMIAFGPDGFLYMGLGDGGGAGDKHGARGNGQDTGTLLGKILRLDVNRAGDAAAYAVPVNNPFVNKAGFRPEIWALGLRNPWRFSFDRASGELWCGDVGQNAHEEVDVIVKGGNYGWRVREGKSPFAAKEEPATQPVLEPVADHERAEAMSVTGGYVYRGEAMPELRGWYVYGDFVTGRFWRLRRDPATGKAQGPVPLPCKLTTLASFGEDAAGELYACCFDGKIYKLMEAAETTEKTTAP